MTEQPASHSATTILPPQSANGTSRQLPSAPSAPKSGRMHTRISGMWTSVTAAARITQLRQIMRRDRRKRHAS
jgi:hypothetical protein